MSDKLPKNANSETVKWTETVTIFIKRIAKRHFITSKFTLEQATKAQRGVEVQLYSSFSLGARWGGLSTPRPDRFILGKDPVPVV